MRKAFWLALGIGAFALTAASTFLAGSARAEDTSYYTFKSALSSGNANWCIDIPGAEYKPGNKLAMWPCVGGAPNQTFGYENDSTLTAGGLCLDGLASNPGQPAAAGDPVVVAECDGSDHQVWELQPFDGNQAEVAIANSAGLCVTVDGPSVGRRTPLVLAQCDQQPSQGFLDGSAPRPVAVAGKGGYGGYPETEYYWFGGHRHCWYDDGWHGGGWYWCGYNHNQGQGWGGPIGWHYWHHFGHALIIHAVTFFDHHHGGHQHVHAQGHGPHVAGPGPHPPGPGPHPHSPGGFHAHDHGPFHPHVVTGGHPTPHPPTVHAHFVSHGGSPHPFHSGGTPHAFHSGGTPHAHVVTHTVVHATPHVAPIRVVAKKPHH